MFEKEQQIISKELEKNEVELVSKTNFIAQRNQYLNVLKDSIIKEEKNKTSAELISKNIKNDINRIIGSQKVFEDHFVVAHRKDHALTKLDRISIEDILSQRHLNISQRRKGPHIIDVELAKLGLERDIALRAQHFLIAPDVVRNSDIVLFCTQSFALRHQLDYVDIPMELPMMEYFLIWHASDDMDGAHIWMRNLLIEAYKNARGIK